LQICKLSPAHHVRANSAWIPLIPIKSPGGNDVRNTSPEEKQRKLTMIANKLMWLILLVGSTIMGSAYAADFDARAAEALMKRSNCNKCHAIESKKDGPSYKETAAKFKGKADGEKQLLLHLTTNPKIKVDGKEELHDPLKTKNEAEILNVVRWILAR
jgi:cytochrome c